MNSAAFTLAFQGSKKGYDVADPKIGGRYLPTPL